MQSTRYSCHFYQTLIFSVDFRKIFKFHKTSTRGSPVVPRSLTGTQMDGRTDGRTDGQTDGQTDKTKLTVAFRISANASIIWTHP